MALKLNQQLKQTQTLTMTPQMQQAINLLTIPHMELTEIINQELVANPILEESYSSEVPQGEKNENQEIKGIENDYFEQQNILNSKETDFDWVQYSRSNNPDISPGPNSGAESLGGKGTLDEDFSYENIVSKDVGLAEYLLWQMNMVCLSSLESEFLKEIVHNLNEDGFFDISKEELLKETTLDEEDALEIIKMVQTCDPLGCASFTLQESLIVQAKNQELKNELAIHILENHFKILEAENLSSLLTSDGISEEDLIKAKEFIQLLSPRPGKIISSTPPQYIIPDVYVKEIKGVYIVSSNEEGIPSLKISKEYQKMLSKLKSNGGKSFEKSTIDYIEDKINSAEWLIKTINFRKSTIQKVAEMIVKKQQNFFKGGINYLTPMILKDIALEIGIHESTVSRATLNKYMHTPLGTFEFKYFFNTGIGGKMGGTDVSSESLKSKIQKMISIEPDKRPLSDQKIADLLKKEGINVARRTVTKYRESLGIPSSAERKAKKI